MTTDAAGARWDAQRSRHASHDAYAQPRTCIDCLKDCRPRYLYCSDACSDRSRAKIRQAREKAAA